MRLSIFGIALFMTGLVVQPAVASDGALAEAPLHDSVQSLNPCFSGKYASADRYLEARSQRFPKVAESEELQAWTRDQYEHMEAAGEGLDCHWMIYGVDGYRVHGFIVTPEGAAAGSADLPVVVLLRGGNADSGRTSLRRLAGQAFPLAQEGFAVVGTSYRGAAVNRGEPHDDRLADEFGGSDVNDVLALLPIIDSIPFVDGERIGIWGNSRGAMMAFLAARASDRFSALVATGAPVDLEKEAQFRPEMEEHVLSVWIPDYEENRERALKARSVIHWVEELSESTALFLAHGTRDERVRAEGVLNLAMRLQALDRDYRLMMFEGGDHSLHSHGSEPLNQFISWFDRHLR